MNGRVPPSSDVYSVPDIRFHLLGPLETLLYGQPLTLRGARPAKVLAAMLASIDVPVSLDRLVEVLWDAPPQSAKQQIHNTVGTLRRTLAPAGAVEIITTEAGYRIRVPEECVDVTLFRNMIKGATVQEAQGNIDDAVGLLESGLGLWRGPALAGLEGRFISGFAAQLNEERVAAVESMIALRLRRGESAALVSELVGLVSEHPLRESLRGSLMLALHHSGRQPEALAVYDDGRRLLQEQLGLDPSPQLRELHSQVLRGEVVPTTQAELAISDAETVVRSFLPRDTGDFVGRAAELQELVSMRRDSSPTALVISAIDGMGGIGKTALAVHLAHQLATEYPGGQYFVDLHGFSVGTDPVTPAQALSDLLSQAGVPVETVPRDLEARSARWRSQLAGQRSLILLDNAKDEAQVRPLLPGTAGTLVLITSRRRHTALEGAFPLSLDTLPAADAVRLFAQIAGPDRVADSSEAVSAIVSLCGHLPLAIRIAAARFRDRKAWSVQHLLEQLRTQQQRARFLATGDRNVMTVIGLSYRYLSATQRTLFRLLSLHPGTDFDPAATAALADLPVAEAEQILEELFEYSLLIQRTAGRYEFHDLVRDCSRELLDKHDEPAAQRTATHRVLDFYLRIANSCCRTVGPFKFTADVQHEPVGLILPTTDVDKVELLAAHYDNLMAAIRFAVDRCWHRHAWQIPCSLLPFLINRGAASVALYGDALAAAKALGDRHGEVASTAGMALVSREQGASAAAEELFRRAVAICVEVGNLSWEAYLTADLGATQLNDGRLQAAYDSFTAAYEAARELGDAWLATALVHNLGVICRETGKYEEALERFAQTSVGGTDVSSLRREAITLINVGAVYHLQNRHVEAIVALDRAVELSHLTSSPSTEASALSRLSAVHRSLGNLEAAIRHGRQGLILARQLELAEVECLALNAIGEAHVTKADLETAQIVFMEAAEAATAHGLERYRARAYEGLAHTSLRRGDPQTARDQWEQALKIYPEGLAEAGNAQTHLRDLTGDTTCHRCAVHLPDASPRTTETVEVGRSPISDEEGQGRMVTP